MTKAGYFAAYLPRTNAVASRAASGQRLEAAGIPPKHLMVYMLIGYDKAETWDRIWHRFNRMVERGISPYPMVFDKSRRDLVCFQRWVITGLYRFVPWNEYKRETRTTESTEAYERVLANAHAPP